MADIKNMEVDGVLYDIKDETARNQIGDLQALSTTEKSDLVSAINELASAAGGGGDACGITYLESTDTSNLVSIRDLESGTYVFYGKFKPFSGSTGTLTFSSKLLVNVVKRTADTQVMVFYPVNNCVQYLKVTDDAYERKNIYLNDLLDAVDTLETSVGTLTDLTTTDKTSLVVAINELAASIPAAYTHPSSHPASMITGLAEVATTGDYNDLDNKPTIPAAYTHPSSHPASMITGLAEVATSGSYDDLADKPTIPTVPSALKNPNALTIDGQSYDGSAAVDLTTTINALIDAKLGVIENGSY